MLLALLLAASTATLLPAQVEQDVAAAQLKRMQTERDLLARRSANRGTLLRNQQELQRAQERVRAAERALQQREER